MCNHTPITQIFVQHVQYKIMGNFLSIVSRSDFNDLYKFGHIFVHNMIPFEGELSEHVDDKLLFDAVTAYMNTYEYSTEYLLLDIRKSPFVGASVEIFIKDVANIFALNTEAQANLSVSLDQRINLQVSCWEKYFNELNKKQSIRQSKAGKFNCYEIFQISTDERNAVEKLLPECFVEDLFNDLYEHKRPNGDKNIWTYLIRYERHHPYWNDMRGFFSDAIHVFENYIQKHEIDYEIAEEVPLGDVLSQCSAHFNDIYQMFMRSADNRYRIDGFNYFAVAPLFLYMKSYFKDGGITPAKFYQNTHLSSGSLHEKYGLDFALAVALLGISLGQDLTYSCYYEIKNLGIFNKSEITKKSKISDPLTGKKLSNEEAQSLIDDLSYKTEELNGEISKLKETIAKLKESIDTAKQGQSKSALTESIESTPNVLDEPSQEEAKDVVSDESSQSASEGSSEIEITTNEPKISFPLEMKKFAKGKKRFLKGKTKWAHNQQEYEEMIKDNWAPFNYFVQNSFFTNNDM